MTEVITENGKCSNDAKEYTKGGHAGVKESPSVYRLLLVRGGQVCKKVSKIDGVGGFRLIGKPKVT